MKKSLILPIIILLFTTIILSTFVLVTKVKSETVIKYEVYRVKSGDTLWAIAKHYNQKNRDIRKYVYDIMIENDMASPDLFPGQILSIPLGD